MSNPFLFTAQVKKVNYKKEVWNQDDADVERYYNIAHSVDVLPIAGKSFINGVPVLRTSRTEFNPPREGDIVVCAYIEGVDIWPVCLGVLPTPIQDESLPTAAIDSRDGKNITYYPYDYVIQHQTGSYIRIRNLEKPGTPDEWGVTTAPTSNRSQITIHNELNNGSEDSIVFNESSAGESTLTISHNTGTEVEIDTSGNVTINAGSNNVTITGGTININGGTVNLNSNGSGVVTQMCACPVTGIHTQSSSTIKAAL